MLQRTTFKPDPPRRWVAENRFGGVMLFLSVVVFPPLLGLLAILSRH